MNLGWVYKTFFESKKARKLKDEFKQNLPEKYHKYLSEDCDSFDRFNALLRYEIDLLPKQQGQSQHSEELTKQ